MIKGVTAHQRKGSAEFKKIVDLSMRAYDFIRLAFIGVAVLLATFMLIRVLPALRFVLLLVLVVLLVMILLNLWRNYLQERESERNYGASIPGQIQERIINCNTQIERLQSEAQKISGSIKELEQQIKKGGDLSSPMQAKTESVLAGFRQELTLRKTKINFYQGCIRKLEKIKQQHELLAALEQKKEELDNLREQHYDEIADMEQLRWEVEKEDTYLETIQDLSTRMQRSNGTEEVLNLQKELEKMLAQ